MILAADAEVVEVFGEELSGRRAPVLIACACRHPTDLNSQDLYLIGRELLEVVASVLHRFDCGSVLCRQGTMTVNENPSESRPL